MDNLFLVLMLISIGVLIYSIKKKNKKHIILSIVGILVFFVAFGMTADEVTSTNKKEVTSKSTKKSNTKETSQDKKEVKASPKKEKTVVKKETEKETPKKEKKENKEVNKPKEKKTKDKPKESVKKETTKKKKEVTNAYQKDLDEYLEMNKGWANGTIDADGNPTDSGAPNQDYYLWNYVTNIKVIEDKEIEVQATEDLKTIPNGDKDNLASSIQGYVMSITGAESANDRLPIYFYNGENALGNSKILEKNKYSWVK